MTPLARLSLCAAIGMATTALAGCADAVWHHPQIADKSAEEQQFTVAKGYCTQVMSGAAPMPSPPILVQPPAGYAVSGTATAFGAPSTYYSGTVTPMPNPGAAFSTGVMNGLAIGMYGRAKREREAIFDGCMAQLGWVKAE